LGSATFTCQGSGLLGWNGSFERFAEGATWEAYAMANATQLLIRCFTDQPAGYCWTGWIVPIGWTLNVPLELERETFSFVGVQEPVYTTDES